MKIQTSKTIGLLLVLALLTSSPGVLEAQSPTEITFQTSEVDVGQGAMDAPIAGSEWSAFGINMIGTDLVVYTTDDPFPPPDNRNGVFHRSGTFWDIVFDVPVIGLQVKWWAPLGPVTLRSFDANDNPLEVMNHGVGEFDTDSFTGAVKRLRVDAAAQAVCIANLQFVPSVVPVSNESWGAIKRLYRD